MFNRFKLALALLGLSSFSYAAGPVYTGLFSNVAIRGYDPVAYFELGEAREGSSEYSTEWNGADWHFINAEHRDRFVADPEAYAPQYGGFCAYAMADGRTARIDPEAYDIVDGRLYLNYNQRIQTRWQADRPGYIEQADRHWTELRQD
ncbi:YHS domain protein [Natronospirillum operosum]|uniref:YHS domain protein n=1 Tax=Natronospirillum operosum TaxID=2759953 RepID=A0A4Z0W8Q9_9GAMM|nr:YHS domain-containing (seleno)protein [Natronospirillum operosum]TGG93947.1 YHS domain protein [Natronospirillum operosum]